MSDPYAERKSLDWIPDSITFYRHQIEGIRKMARMGSFICADEMGLGKSIQALTVFAIDVQRGRAEKCLCVALATLKGNWKDEIKSHTLFPATVLEGTPKQREKVLAEFANADGPRILIVNYEQVASHLGSLNELDFDVVIYDEAHTMKNPRAKRTKACQALRARRHFLLTGSPMLNHVNELWSLLHRIAPAEFPSYWSFVNRYCVYGGFKDKQIVGVKNEAELTRRLQAVMVRRLKKDVLDLPDKQYITVTVDLAPEQRTLYREIADELRATLPGSADPMEIENALTKFLRLKQVCGTTATIPGYPDVSWKLDRAVQMIQELAEGGHKAVVFTQFRKVLECLQNRLSDPKIGLAPYVLHGDVVVADRVPTVTRWASDEDPNPILCMWQVAGVGLNMTASRHIIEIDRLFVPALNAQGEDRAHRIGADMTQPVQIFKLIARGTIESRIEAILTRKSRLFNTIVEINEFKRRLYQAILEEDDEEDAA